MAAGVGEVQLTKTERRNYSKPISGFVVQRRSEYSCVCLS